MLATDDAKQRILLVDDEPQVLSALTRLLKRAGFEVASAGSGEEALAKLEQFAPDLVLSDFRMPRMNGSELLEQVRLRLPGARRAILTGNADVTPLEEAISAGRIHFWLTKPWNNEELLTRLRGVSPGSVA
jgi:CheY-like chemotaxis protein